VYSLMLGTKPTIILSSDVAIKDLLDKRGGIYSDRPDMFISQRVASGGHRLVVMVSSSLNTPAMRPSSREFRRPSLTSTSSEVWRDLETHT
jgi:hypothetical protein